MQYLLHEHQHNVFNGHKSFSVCKMVTSEEGSSNTKTVIELMILCVPTLCIKTEESYGTIFI